MANVNEVMGTLDSALKLAANLTERKDDFKANDSSNNTVSTPNQTVQIQLAPDTVTKKDEPEHHQKKIKPQVIVKREFPEARALTPEECNLALERDKMANAYRIQEFEYRKLLDDINRRDRLAREEQERKEREEKRAKAEKQKKIQSIIGAIFGAAAAGLIGYSVYRDYKINISNVSNINTNPIHTEGTVK